MAQALPRRGERGPFLVEVRLQWLAVHVLIQMDHEGNLVTPQGHHRNDGLWPKSGQNVQKWSYFGFIWTSGNAIDVISIQQLDNVVFYRLRYLNRGRCAQI